MSKPYQILTAAEITKGAIQVYQLSYLRVELAHNRLRPQATREYEIRLQNLWKPHHKQSQFEVFNTYRAAQARFAKLAKQIHAEHLIERATERLKYGLCPSTMRFEDRRHDFRYHTWDKAVVCVACGQLRWEDKYPPIENVGSTRAGGGE